MSPRRKDGEDQLLGDQLVPRPTRQPTPIPNPLARLSAANKAMYAGVDPPPPSRMQPPEDQVGYVLVLAVVILGVILTIVHGKGSPKHPHHWIQIIGIVVAVLTPVAIFRWANRFITAIMVVVAAFCISLVTPPSSWIGLYYVVLISPLGYAFWLTRRQSKAARELNGRGGSRNNNQRRSSSARGGRGQSKEPEGPAPNRRYTPPKGPRERPKRSEVAAAAPEPTSRRQRRRDAAEEKASKNR